MEYYEPFTKGMIDKGIVDIECDAEDLFEDIKQYLIDKDFESAAQEVMWYEDVVYGLDEDEYPCTQEECKIFLEDLFNKNPFTSKDVEDYDKGFLYELNLTNMLIDNKIAMGNLARHIAHMIKEDLMKADIKSAIEKMNMTAIRSGREGYDLDLTLKLGKIAAQLLFEGERESELD